VSLGDFDVVRAVDGATAALGAGVDLTAPGIGLAGRLAIGMGVMVGEGATLEDTVVMPEAWVGPGSALRRCIVGSGTEIPAAFEAADALLAADTDRDVALPSGVERVAGLLLRRFPESSS
jgi:bifunctional N-acetylglucosamine-1-phosphate-uridyltransferase/glucosamine-1-phosphate-acetyltransferase GlmU-like protein